MYTKSVNHMDLCTPDRNRTDIFAQRTLKNLDFIVRCASEGSDVHVVTQAISALLGIVVFPWETDAFDRVEKKELVILYAKGWPKWDMGGPRKIITLGDLIEVLRHAACHSGIGFDSDSRDPSEVTVSFKNVPPRTKVIDWTGTITGDRLIEFCRLFSSAMRDAVA
jgi:hypothetical protein